MLDQVEIQIQIIDLLHQTEEVVEILVIQFNKAVVVVIQDSKAMAVEIVVVAVLATQQLSFNNLKYKFNNL